MDDSKLVALLQSEPWGMSPGSDLEALAATWRSSGIVALDDVRAWLSLGVYDGAAALALRRAGIEPADLVLFPEPENVIASFVAGETTLDELKGLLAVLTRTAGASLAPAETFVRATAEGASAESIQPGARVLLVDDHDDDRSGMAHILRSAAFDVVPVAGGREALDHLLDPTNAEPDVIVLDLVMPEMSGWEFLAIMKSYYRLQRIPTILVSGKERPNAALHHHAIDKFLAKPLHATELVALVHGCLARCA